MRIIETGVIADAVRDLFICANYRLPEDITERICLAEKEENAPLASGILQKLLENCKAASECDLPVCQDTGMAVIFAEIGKDVCFMGERFEDAVNDGVRRAYAEGYLRKSVVRDPLFDRVNTDDNTPALIYISYTDGDRVRLTAAPKGFGSENMSALRMFIPSAVPQDIVNFVVETVKKAGGMPCPPIVIGVGIGGDFEYAAYLAKKALIRDTRLRNPDERYAALEEEILQAVNETGIGPQGFGGKTTALAVNIEKYPTHIAGLPCAVNIGCYVTRHASIVL